MTTTAGQWIDLPTSGGSDDRFAKDLPGGSGLFALTASNLTLAARENGLRTVWEDAGSALVYTDLPTAGDSRSFPWHLEDSDGIYARCCGTFRVRLHGETVDVPRIRLHVRALAPAGETTGVILAVETSPGAPFGLRTATDTTTSTSAVDLEMEVALSPEDLGRGSYSVPQDAAPEERGDQTEVTIWVGAWCTSDDALSKGAVYGLSVSVIAPT